MLPPRGYELAGKNDHGAIVHDPQRDRAAAITVCAHATDHDDARALLEALGLIPQQREES